LQSFDTISGAEGDIRLTDLISGFVDLSDADDLVAALLPMISLKRQPVLKMS